MRSAGLGCNLHPEWDSRRLWSLWDIMINYSVFGLCHLLRQLFAIENDFELRIAHIDAEIKYGGGYAAVVQSNIPHEVSELDRKRIDGLLEFAIRQADQLELQAVHDRIDLFKIKLRGHVRLDEFLAEVRTLRETFEKGLNFKRFYLHPERKAAILLQFEHAWGKINVRFPSAKADAEAAVDCWALGHDTASVFHLMRVAEYGLRALARERKIKVAKKPLEWATWEDILSRLRKQIDLIGGWKAGAARSAALDFYRGALGEFEAFKDAYRNDVMHTRKAYDTHQALSVQAHVREFMDRLSAKIGEDPKRQIAWKKETSATRSRS
jgi:hypothetical protein